MAKYYYEEKAMKDYSPKYDDRDCCFEKKEYDHKKKDDCADDKKDRKCKEDDCVCIKICLDKCKKDCDCSCKDDEYYGKKESKDDDCVCIKIIGLSKILKDLIH